MKIKTSELTRSALNWAVAIAEGIPPEELKIPGYKGDGLYRYLRNEDGELDGHYMTGPDLLFSSKWEAGGQIIEREFIELRPGSYIGKDRFWAAWSQNRHGDRSKGCTGPTALIAAMRCYVAFKLGDEVEIPKKLA